MEKREYMDWLRTELTPYELGVFNYALYWNPKHVKLWVLCVSEQWGKAKKYTEKHRGFLKLKNVPKKHRKAARASVEASKSLYSQRVATVSMA